MVVNLSLKTPFILELKRTSGLDPIYREAALNKAKKQYQDKIEGLRRMLPEEWTVMSVYIMTGMASVNKEAWSVIRVGR